MCRNDRGSNVQPLLDLGLVATTQCGCQTNPQPLEVSPALMAPPQSARSGWGAGACIDEVVDLVGGTSVLLRET